MANDTQFFKKMILSIQANICVSAPAKVVKVHGKKADVKPLFKDNGQEAPLILDAYILKSAGTVVVGDVVHLNFTDRALDYLGKQPFNPTFSRMHSINDAVIVGVYDL
ncbi:Gp138 family membrane-puncturing spike protein [Priestia flexa]|uniref:Gp138 family membrane-puncturing spike protein n=1 Tax=Priestia flexa TaxID=86664 RepID=UPI003F82CC14